MRNLLRSLEGQWHERKNRLEQKGDFWFIIGAFAVVYIVWGATYLFNYFAIQAIPPFLMSGSRFLVAGGLLYTFLFFRGTPRPTVQQWLWSALLGVLFLGLGTGCLVWALQYIDTGLSALLVAIDPLLIMMLLWAIKGVKPGRGGLFGAFLGIWGMYLLLGQPQLRAEANAWKGLLAISVSMLGWALASIYVSRLDLPSNRSQRAAMQMLAGGTLLTSISFFSGEMQQFNIENVDWKAGLSWLYLVLFGSILAFSCFNYLLSKVSPEKVATSTYVNPLVAVAMGWAFNDEKLGPGVLLAGVLMLVGVYFINMGKR